MALDAAEMAPVVTALRAPAFEEVYRREFPALGRYCLRLTADEQAARDAAQEAFVRLFARWTSVREPRAWLYLVATNIIRDRWKQQLRQKRAAAGLAAAQAESAAAPDVAVRDAVQRLPARLRPIVLLHYFADLRVEDIAVASGLPAGTVKRRLHEARTILAQTLGEEHD